MPRGKKSKTPDVKVPEAVLRAQKKAAEAQKQAALAADPNAEPVVDDPNVQDPNAEPAVAPVVDDPSKSDPPVSKDVDPGPAVKVEPVNPDGIDPDLFKDVQDPDPNDYETKYKALQGKFDSELERYRTALEANEKMVATLSEQVKMLQDNPAAPATSPGPADIPVLDVEKYSGYGPEMKEMANLVNGLQGQLKEAYNVIEALKNQGPSNPTIDALKNDVASIRADTHNQRLSAYEQYLDQTIVDRNGQPVWQKIKHDPRFHTWLKEEDELTGIPRGKILLKHNNDANGPKVAMLFKRFISSLTAQPQNTGSNPNLESQVVPDSAGGDGLPPKKEDDTVTLDEYKEATKLMTQGKLSMEEYQKVNVKFQNSIRKGKVQGVPMVTQ